MPRWWRAVGGAPGAAARDADGKRLVHQHVLRAHAHLESRAVDEWLEGGAGLAPRLVDVVELLGREIAAAHPGQDVAVARVQRHEAALQRHGLFALLAAAVRQRLQRIELPGQCLVRGLLQFCVQRGAHDQPVGVDVEAARVGPRDQPLAHPLRHVGRGAGGLVLPLEVEPQRRLGEALGALGIELAVLDHLREHEVAPVARALGVEHGVVVARALEHAHQRGRLQHAQLAGGLVEIGARRHLDAEGVVEEGHGVEVGLEDLVLGVQRLDLEGRQRLLDLAVHADRAADLLRVQVARELLRERGAALGAAAQRVEDGGRGAPHVDAVVAVEAMVLRGDQPVDHMRRDLRQRHPLAVQAPELGQHHAVGRHHHGGKFGLGLAQVGDAGRERQHGQHVQQQQPGQHEGRAHGVAAGERPEAAKEIGDPHLGAGKLGRHGQTLTVGLARAA